MKDNDPEEIWEIPELIINLMLDGKIDGLMLPDALLIINRETGEFRLDPFYEGQEELEPDIDPEMN